MLKAAIGKRLVFHLGGYDPMPPDAVHRRFLRELRRFQSTWGLQAQTTDPEISASEARWQIATSGPGWRVETEYRLIRWDDVIAAGVQRSTWRRVPLGLLAFADFLFGGALWGYLRTNWRYAGFFLYPYLLLSIFSLVALAGGTTLGILASSALVGTAATCGLFVALLRWPGRLLFLHPLLDDWIFAREYIRGEHPVLGPRLDAMARNLCETARAGAVDEILVIGHSLGAVLAIDLLDRALQLEPMLGRNGGPRVAFLSVGSSIPKIGLHRAARRFRAAVERVAHSPAIFWGEYQALTDVMNFYKADPIACMGLSGRSPIIRQVRVRAMLEPAAYARVKGNFFRVHCQFVSANDRRAAYDYFMFVCGPFATEDEVRSQDGAISAMAAGGRLSGPPAPRPRAVRPERRPRAARR